jgi:cell fate regulator YaaT (PSP1 superfamily)
MFEAVKIRLRQTGKVVLFLTKGIKVKLDDCVIVEIDRGLDYGYCISDPISLAELPKNEPLKSLVRLANQEDIARIEDNRKKAKEALETCEKKIAEHKLAMKLISAEYVFDRSKIIFYYTAEERVDFRSLVKDLAQIFRTRIEMMHIGVRDEARMFGGYGPCGRPLCCTKFLKEFDPVTVRMAKEQNLSPNPTKISGICGRLMCCLGYEYEAYKELMKGLPKEGQRISTKEGKGKVIGVNAITGKILVELEDGGKQIEIKYGK